MNSENNHENFIKKDSKLVLLLISILGFGLFGLDRFYTGEIKLGLIKLFTFGGFTIWAMIDYFIVLFNVLTKSENGLFGIEKWSDDLDTPFYTAIVILIFKIITIFYIFYLIKDNKEFNINNLLKKHFGKLLNDTSKKN